MNAYTLDFSRPARPGRRPRPNRWPRQRRYVTFRRMAVRLSCLVCSLALFGLLRQRTQTRLIQERYQAKIIQYDSLLTAKVEVDQQLEQMRIRLTK